MLIKALTSAAKDAGLDGQLGRKALPDFQVFKSKSSESAVCRFVRMACEILGPRGDEKCGCHGDWLAFCSSGKKCSLITSFRGNRFNNLFAAAAQLLHHRADILRFFQLRPPGNYKQKSVAADAASDNLMHLLLGLALFYVYYTGPFWVFVRSDVHYLDQYAFIQPMFFSLREMIQHPDLLLGPDAIPDELESFRLRKEPAAVSVLDARDSVAGEQKAILQVAMRHIAKELAAAVQRQLSDFLVGGRYGAEPTPDQRAKMKQCKLTNLIGEACFGDLDYSMFTRRGATLHHHSTLSMVKRNHTVSKWLLQKSEEEQEKLIKRARSLGPQMRHDDHQKELAVLEQTAENMQHKQQEQQEHADRQQQKLRLQTTNIVQTISDQGGACHTATDIVALLGRYTTKRDKLKALKAQVDYQKVVLRSVSPLLKVTKVQLQDLATNLIVFMCGEESGAQAAVEVAAVCTTSARKKRQLTPPATQSNKKKKK